MNKFNIYFFLFLFCCLASCINDKKIEVKKNTEDEKKSLIIDYEDTLSTEIKSINKIDTSRRIPEDRINLKDSQEYYDDYHSEEVIYFKRYINKAYSKKIFENSINSNIRLLDSLVKIYENKQKKSRQ